MGRNGSQHKGAGIHIPSALLGKLSLTQGLDENYPLIVQLGHGTSHFIDVSAGTQNSPTCSAWIFISTSEASENSTDGEFQSLPAWIGLKLQEDREAHLQCAIDMIPNYIGCLEQLKARCCVIGVWFVAAIN